MIECKCLIILTGFNDPDYPQILDDVTPRSNVPDCPPPCPVHGKKYTREAREKLRLVADYSSRDARTKDGINGQ